MHGPLAFWIDPADLDLDFVQNEVRRVLAKRLRERLQRVEEADTSQLLWALRVETASAALEGDSWAVEALREVEAELMQRAMHREK